MSNLHGDVLERVEFVKVENVPWGYQILFDGQVIQSGVNAMACSMFIMGATIGGDSVRKEVLAGLGVK